MNPDLTHTLQLYYEAWSRQDPELVMEFFSDKSSFEDLGFAAKFVGLVQIRSFVDITYSGAPDFKVEPTKIIVGAGCAAAEWTMTGTHSGNFPGLPATGKRFEVRAASIIDFDDTKIYRIVDYWNPIEFQRSVGIA